MARFISWMLKNFRFLSFAMTAVVKFPTMDSTAALSLLSSIDDKKHYLQKIIILNFDRIPPMRPKNPILISDNKSDQTVVS